MRPISNSGLQQAVDNDDENNLKVSDLNRHWTSPVYFMLKFNYEYVIDMPRPPTRMAKRPAKNKTWIGICLCLANVNPDSRVICTTII